MSDSVSESRLSEDIFMAEMTSRIQAVVAASEARRPPDHNGRPCLISQPRLESIIRKIARGTPKTKAAQACGICPKTWQNWQEDHPDLFEMASEAAAFVVSQLAEEIREGVDIKGNPDWKARAWLAERLDKDNFAGPKQVEINNTVNHNSATFAVLDQAQVQALQEAHKAAALAIANQRRLALPVIEAEIVPST
jgi:hypothetical protein